MEYSEYVEGRDSTTPTGIDLVAIIQGGVAKKITASQLTAIEYGIISVDTSGSTLALDFGAIAQAYSRSFVGSASFATAKNVTLPNSTNANHFTLIFEITDVAATLTFPAGFKSSDSRFLSLVFTSDEIGIFKLTADFDGTSWYADFSPLPYV